jgi:hypothetical protein
MKTEVYSWRVSSDLKTGLEREARRRKIPVSAVLAIAARDLLDRSGSEREGNDEQKRLRAAASKWIGALSGRDPRRSQNGSAMVRQRLRRRYGR